MDNDGLCDELDECPLDFDNDIDGDGICGDIDQYPYCESPDGYDCSGLCGGSSYIDLCGVCDDDPLNDCILDCADCPGGCAYVDECGVCDDDPLNDCIQDCNGDWGGDAYLDECEVCDEDPTNDCAQDCNGDWGGIAYTNSCGICVDGNTNLENLNEYGYELGMDCLGICSGDSYFDDCGVCDSDTLNDNLSCSGCMNEFACNYDELATIDDSSCIYYDCAGECGGVAFIDDCGVCSEGTSNNIENSDDLGCGCFNEGPINFYYDQDEDGLGHGEPQLYCEDIAFDETENSIYELPPENWVPNNLDPCPLDIENDSDQDGLCVYEDEDICPNDYFNDIDADGICGDIDTCPLDPDNDTDADLSLIHISEPTRPY